MSRKDIIYGRQHPIPHQKKKSQPPGAILCARVFLNSLYRMMNSSHLWNPYEWVYNPLLLG